jgi:hypothetical protein
MDTSLIINKEHVSVTESVVSETGDIQPVYRKRLIPTQDYISRFMTQFGKDDYVLPRNCRKVLSMANNSRIIVLEEVPKTRYIKFEWDFVEEIRRTKKTGQSSLELEKLIEGQKIPYTLKLQLPYVVFLVHVQEKIDMFDMPFCRVFFRNHPITSSGDYLAYANFFNISNGNEICFGHNKKSYSKRTHSLATAVEDLIALYWATPFAAEYRCRHDKYKNTPPMNSFLAWSAASQKPAFAYNIPLIMHDKTLQEETEQMITTRSSASFDRVFILPLTEQHSEESGIVAYQNLKLVQNTVSIGDRLTYQDQEYYIDGIVGTCRVPKNIDLVKVSGEKITVELTPALLNQWDSDIAAHNTNYLDSITVGDQTVVPGKIIRINVTSTYEIVDKIRLARDNTIEFLMGQKFFLAIPGTYQIIDCIKAGDIELVNGEEYMILNNQYRTFFKGRMSRIQNNSYNILHVFFDINGEERGISVDSIYNGDFSVIKHNDPRIQFTRTFRFMDQIISDSGFCIIQGVGIFSTSDSNTIWTNNFNRGMTIADVLKDESTRLEIKSFDQDINFKVGDEVIIPNWRTPETLFKIWKINSFTTSDSYLSINVKCGEEVSQFDYINFSNGKIQVGGIRKITRSLNGISIGTLIQAKNSGILGFPKKVINRVAAIITDSHAPLILCENGLTISCDHINQFNIITSTSRRFETINLNKIAWQTGDLCTCSEKFYVYNSDNTYLGKLYMLVDPIFVKSGSFKSKAVISTKNHPDFIRHGILNPRLSKSRSRVVYEQIHDFVNGTTHTLSDGYYPSTIPNVSEVEAE